MIFYKNIKDLDSEEIEFLEKKFPDVTIRYFKVVYFNSDGGINFLSFDLKMYRVNECMEVDSIFKFDMYLNANKMGLL
jgi:hypothetical protein